MDQCKLSPFYKMLLCVFPFDQVLPCLCLHPLLSITINQIIVNFHKNITHNTKHHSFTRQNTSISKFNKYHANNIFVHKHDMEFQNIKNETSKHAMDSKHMEM
jgi:hypothetical protein